MKIKECGPRGGGASLAQPAPSGSANLCGFRACSHERCNYRQQRSCGQGNIFKPVCHSFCSQGGICLVLGGGGIPACTEADPPTPHTPGRPPRTRQTPQDQAEPPWDQADPPGPGRPLGPGRPPRDQADPPPPQGPGRPPGPGRQTPPRTRQTPPPEADSSIRSTSGRYASYWNAFLFSESVTELLLPFFCRIHLSQQQIPREMCQINV